VRLLNPAAAVTTTSDAKDSGVMKTSCYSHDVAILQVKSLPDDLYAELQRRAHDEGTTVSDFVTRMLRRELTKPSLAKWLAEMPGKRQGGKSVDTAVVLDEIRGPWG